MSTIRCIYQQEPNFPATDQHPDAKRYKVGPHIVDAIGDMPTLAEVEAILEIDEAGLRKRELEQIERAGGMTRLERDLAIAALPADHNRRVKAEAMEAEIAALGVRKSCAY